MPVFHIRAPRYSSSDLSCAVLRVPQFPHLQIGNNTYLFYRLHNSGASGSLRAADVCAFTVLFVQVFLPGIFSGQVLSGQQVIPVNLKTPLPQGAEGLRRGLLVSFSC